MKILVLLFVTQFVFALNINTLWNEDFSKNLVVDCAEDEMCQEFFGTQSTIQEEICSDCFSTDLNATFIFNGIGESITAGESVSLSEFFSYLKLNNFVSISYDSPYDLITTSSTMQKRLKFRDLCEDYTQDPILFFDKSLSNEISTPRFIFCGETVYDLEMFDVIIDSISFDLEIPLPN